MFTTDHAIKLPRRFMRIRHYGLHHSFNREKLARCRKLLGAPAEEPAEELVLAEWVEEILGEDPRVCPFCSKGRMVRKRTFEPMSSAKAKLLSLLGIPARGKKKAA